MADITLRLLWYKLGEVSGNMAEAGKSWYTELDFDSYVLDLILLGWCSVCVLIMVAVNAIVSALGPLQRKPQDRGSGSASSDQGGAQLPIETCQWFSHALNWLYLHYYYAPEFLDEWVNSLNEQLVKLGGPVPAKIEQIQNGSLPPKVTHVSCEASPKDKFIIHARIESRDLAFQLFASQQTQQGVKLTNCTANVLRLKGLLRIESYRDGADVKVAVNFQSSKPEIKLLVKPNNPYQEESELVDLGVVEENIRHAIGLAKTTFTITHLLMPGDLHTVGHYTSFEGYGGIQGHGQGKESRSSTKKAAPSAQPLATSTPVPGSSAAAASAAPSLQKQQQKQQQQQRQPPSRHAEAPPSQPRPVEESFAPASAQVQRSAPPVREELSSTIQVPQHQAFLKEVKPSLMAQPLPSQPQQQPQPAAPVQRRDQQRVRPQSRPEGVFEPVEAAHLQSAAFSAPPKPPRMVGDKRLLVKIIKANGLTLQELGSSNVVCMVSTDEPVQGYGTSVVKNTCHPFWDEHFLFDITHETQEVHVEIYDTAKPPGEDFIGESVVYVDDLRKTPSSRQILRLHPDPNTQEYNSGTVTAEFLFMDPHEADLLMDSMCQQASHQLSPRRWIEVERSMAPGGTLITTTTTTTERSPFGRHEPGLDGSPNYIEKNVHSDDQLRFSYNDSSSNVSSEYRQQPPIPTVEGPHDDDLDNPHRPHGGQEKEKKKGSFGSALLKRFGRGKKRAQSADRTLTSSMREGSYLRPPEPAYGPQSKDDLELVRRKQEPPPSPTLKKSRTLGGSLKKLFRRGRKRSQGRGGDNSRDNSLTRTRGSGGGSKGPSRDNSLTRPLDQRAYERASSVS